MTRQNQSDSQRRSDKAILAAILSRHAPLNRAGDKQRQELSKTREVFSSRSEAAKICQEIAGKTVAVKNSRTEDEKFEGSTVFVHRDAPLLIMIPEHQRIIAEA